MKPLNAPAKTAIARDDLSNASYEVAIVGAGLTGLRLAQLLDAAGISTVVVEAADHAGGRVLSRELCPGCTVDLGAEFVGPTQNHVLALAEQLGLTLDTVSTTGENLFESSAGLSRYPAADAVPPVDPDSLAQLMECAVELDANAAEPPDGPSVGAQRDLSVGDWIRARETTVLCSQLLRFVCRSITSAEPAKVSMRHLIAQVRAAGDSDNAGSIFRIISTTGGAQMYRIAEGSGQLVQRLLATLTCPVIGVTPVSVIEDTSTGYRLRGKGFELSAQKAVVAASPALARRISYRFAVDPAIVAHHESYRLGKSIKFAAAYRSGFWLTDGLSGHLNSTLGPVQSIYSRSFDESGDALVGFIKADDAAELIQGGRNTIQAGIDQHLVRVFGPAAADHDQLELQVWDEQSWSGGCPCGFEPVGSADPLAAADAVPARQDGVLWCATESATHWRGYMDGALGAAEAAYTALSREAISAP